jgi:hypothetical protein
MSAQETVLPESAIPASESALPVAEVAPRVVVVRSNVGLRAWMLTLTLFLVPLVAYWPAVFHDYGLRDDYSNVREAHEEPGKIVRFCASQARPIYGWLLQATYGQTTSVQNLQWMRLLATLLLGAISWVIFRGLYSVGWSFNSSLCVGLLVALIPSAQVIAGWAIGWRPTSPWMARWRRVRAPALAARWASGAWRWG